MPAPYKTPDVYVEEISLFPPSVAEVATAIPAFVGYTEKATRIISNDLRNVPTRIKSLLEYETLFGRAPRAGVTEVVIDESDQFVSCSLANNYYLYDSLRLYFDNGGGPCYIVAVDCYPTSIAADKLQAGIKVLSKVDEPTILLFPDAASLSASELASVQQTALSQCGKLGDRVAVLDTRQVNDSVTAATEIQSFRDRIGINNLKYGVSYSPWLKVSYSKNVSYADIRSVLRKGTVPVTLQALCGDAQILAQLNLMDSVLVDATTMATRLATLTGAGKTIASRQGELLTAYKSGKTAANMQELFNYLFSLARFADALVTTDITNADLKATAIQAIGNSLKPIYTRLIALEKELDGKLTAPYTPQWNALPLPAHADWGGIFVDATSPAASATGISGADDIARLDSALTGISTAFTAASGVIASLVAAAGAYRNQYEQFLLDNMGVYRNIIRGINSTTTACPPSGAVAGIYAFVDNQRGVWKAPANVSLNSVIEPTYYFDRDDTDNLNVDTVSGKSVNALLAFSGKGTLVWGARTLAGNDNEWRYISVRRFFNMVEESVKKSTYWAVFESNDANTWVKVRGMIENYLTQKWREGALAGATTKDAFFVKCGLGVTMTAQDILEGRMNVEIGMAVVRPAEFIILKFSHKLQTS